MAVKDRLIQFIESLNLSPSQFEKSCEISNGYVNNIRKSIGEETLKKIEKKYPQLNKIWLLHGEGQMINKSGDPDYKEKYFELLEKWAQVNERRLKELEVKNDPTKKVTSPKKPADNNA